MKISTLLTDIGDILQEDFLNSPIWTKAEILEYIRIIIRAFSVNTGIVDKIYIRNVNPTTGEAGVPEDFDRIFYLLFNQTQVDLVRLSDLDFLQSDWTTGTTGTPHGATVFGSGSNAVIRFVPVPDIAAGLVYGGGYNTLTVTSPDGNIWNITIAAGNISTTISGVTTTSFVLPGLTTFWDLTINNVGVLSTAASAQTSADVVYLTDSTTSALWQMKTDDAGAIAPGSAHIGIVSRVVLDGVVQAFFSDGSHNTGTTIDHGIIVDAYTTGVSTTATATIHLNKPIGVSIYDRNADDAAVVWYKGRLDDVVTPDSELYVDNGFIVVIKWGVLALAYEKENDGQDLEKSQLMWQLFTLGCNAIKRIFQRK